MRQNNARQIALGGVFAALAVVIMCLGGFIPVATYICPMLCCATQFIVLRYCGKRIAWVWYIVVALISTIMGPDKVAVFVFFAIGYYPMLKSFFDCCKLGLLLKLLFFNVTILLAYFVMIHFLGMQEIATENMEFGVIGLAVILALGNITFLLLDKLLAIMSGKMR